MKYTRCEMTIPPLQLERVLRFSNRVELRLPPYTSSIAYLIFQDKALPIARIYLRTDSGRGEEGQGAQEFPPSLIPELEKKVLSLGGDVKDKETEPPESQAKYFSQAM